MKENKGEQPEQENPFKKWLATKDGKDCMKRATFLSDKELDYLENRLWYAFTAGMGEMAELITPAQPSKVQEDLKKENSLLEAREVAWQNKHSFLMEEIGELKAWKEDVVKFAELCMVFGLTFDGLRQQWKDVTGQIVSRQIVYDFIKSKLNNL